jgi:hypothetical protein
MRMSDSANEYTTSPSRRTGRPRNADRPIIPWEEVDRLLVFGETVRDDATGHETVRYPSYRELGRRYGVSAALIGRYASQHRCMERREENHARQQIRFEQKVVEKCAEARAISTAEAVAIVDDYIRRFRDALDEGRVRADGASDFNTMMRLKAFLEGKADSRQEVQGVITLEQMQARHRALRAQLEALDPAVTGELPPRDRDRARGLLAESADGDQADHPAAAPRRRSDDDIERAPRRRVVAHERDDELVDDVPLADREESPRGGERVLRRTDRYDDIERAPRRRVVAYEREDELDDEVLAEEREESPRGAVGARRRRTHEHEGFDDEAVFEEARVPRRARAVKPADVRALRRRTREELEDGRVARRARSVEPERVTAQRLRRSGREERARFPAVVDARRPGRGWEDEPEQIEPGLRRPGRGWR